MLEEAKSQVAQQEREIQQLRESLEEKVAALQSLDEQLDSLRREKESAEMGSQQQTELVSQQRDAVIEELQQKLVELEGNFARKTERVKEKLKKSEAIKKAELSRVSSQLSISFAEREKLLEELKRFVFAFFIYPVKTHVLFQSQNIRANGIPRESTFQGQDSLFGRGTTCIAEREKRERQTVAGTRSTERRAGGTSEPQTEDSATRADQGREQ